MNPQFDITEYLLSLIAVLLFFNLVGKPWEWIWEWIVEESKLRKSLANAFFAILTILFSSVLLYAGLLRLGSLPIEP